MTSLRSNNERVADNLIRSISSLIVASFSIYESVVGTYAFIGAYAQQFLFAISFNHVKEYMPIPAGLYEFIGYQTIKWNEMMAASLVGILPVLFVFLFLQKYIVEGLTAGAVKN